jgi:hypothetical protein
MIAGDTNRIRIVSIHADWTVNFRFGNDSVVARWTPLAVDGADLPLALRQPKLARLAMGPGETADFIYVPARPGEMDLEAWTDGGLRVVLPVKIVARPAAGKR